MKIDEEVLEILEVMKESILVNDSENTNEIERIEKIQEYIRETKKNS